ncbi:regulator of cell morphogenesis and NO signaling [Lentibacillus persicus]|uniref:Regulator of cell morphogenesis and NO signaling n=1 Tax=Lentibacillus persicus TaxID=640948 RepID=A0A1I1VMK1_9BACI|nr:iron-sulfur cluster repair di-iron protein [Lentibacillus persicus]SFD84044.1 regulator of cell morphogenesis and NO signaling [Lentibacillus persicus]
MTEFTAEHTPAEVVKVFPKASDLFKQRRIDFCCGGDRPLGEVFKERNIDEVAVMDELNHSFQDWQKEDHEVVDLDTKPLSELIDHIVHSHHAYLYEELPALGKFVSKIFRVHGKNHPHLKELHRLYNDFKVDMEEHTVNEEENVFPLIKEYEHNPNEELLERIKTANGGLEDDHDASGNILKHIREITNGFQPPRDACNSYRITYARLAELESDTFQHIHLENHVLFKRL